MHCPNCGDDESWVAQYVIPVEQGCFVKPGPDGLPIVDTYDGSYETADAKPDDEVIMCQNCNWRVEYGMYVWQKFDKPKVVQPEPATWDGVVIARARPF